MKKHRKVEIVDKETPVRINRRRENTGKNDPDLSQILGLKKEYSHPPYKKIDNVRKLIVLDFLNPAIRVGARVKDQGEGTGSDI